MYNMGQDVDTGFNTVCKTCLSSNRDLFAINNVTHVYKIFRLIMHDFVSEEKYNDPVYEMKMLICWECIALLNKFAKFKQRVHCAQEYIRKIPFATLQKNIDHIHIPQSLSTLVMKQKTNYDYVLKDDKEQENSSLQTVHKVKTEPGTYDRIQTPIDNVRLNYNTQNNELSNHIVPEIVLKNSKTEDLHSKDPVGFVKCEILTDTIDNSLKDTNIEEMVEEQGYSRLDKNRRALESSTNIVQQMNVKTGQQLTTGYYTEYMTEQEMLDSRNEAKHKLDFVRAAYKCELCIIGFRSVEQLREHLDSLHETRAGFTACKVCFVHVDDSNLLYHVNNHYFRYTCKVCGLVGYNARTAQHHACSHLPRDVTLTDVTGPTDTEPNAFSIVDVPSIVHKIKMRTEKEVTEENSTPMETEDTLLSDTDGQYDSLDSDMMLDETPKPKEECPVCHKMIKATLIESHIERHKHKALHECKKCAMKFSYKKSYLSHIFRCKANPANKPIKNTLTRYPCSLCDKVFATEPAMRNHWNDTHMRKTDQKCSICEKFQSFARAKRETEKETQVVDSDNTSAGENGVYPEQANNVSTFYCDIHAAMQRKEIERSKKVPKVKKVPKTGAERIRTYRERIRALEKASAAASNLIPGQTSTQEKSDEDQAQNQRSLLFEALSRQNKQESQDNHRKLVVQVDLHQNPPFLSVTPSTSTAEMESDDTQNVAKLRRHRKIAKTPAERARDYRKRKKELARAAAIIESI